MITVKRVKQAIAEGRCYLAPGKAPTNAAGTLYTKPYRRCCITDHPRMVKLWPKEYGAYGRVLYIRHKPDTPFTARGAVCVACSTAIRTLIAEVVP